MNILIITPELPWPAETGGKASQFATLKALAADHSFRIVVSRASPLLPSLASELERELPHVTVARGDTHPQTPTTSRTAPGMRQRLKGMARRILRRGRQPEPAANGSKPSSERPYYPFVPLSTETLALIEANLDWADLIQAEFHESLYTAFMPIRHKPKLFICHQAHGRFCQRFYSSQAMATSAALTDGNADTPTFMAATDTAAARAMEARCMAGFDHIITFTEDDQQALWQQDASLPISVSPFPIPADCTIVPPAEVHRWDLRLVYVGSALWYPNVQAVQWFGNRVYPLLREQLPAEACRLQVVGHWPEAQRQSLPQESVHFLGYAEQIAAVLSGNISINPVFTGAGLRTKLLASAACTSPIVSTSIGCEGMGFRHGDHCLIADGAEDFAAAILALMRDQSMAALLATRAFEAALQTFGPEAVRQRRNRIYAEVCGQFAAGS